MQLQALQYLLLQIRSRVLCVSLSASHVSHLGSKSFDFRPHEKSNFCGQKYALLTKMLPFDSYDDGVIMSYHVSDIVIVKHYNRIWIKVWVLWRNCVFFVERLDGFIEIRNKFFRNDWYNNWAKSAWDKSLLTAKSGLPTSPINNVSPVKIQCSFWSLL